MNSPTESRSAIAYVRASTNEEGKSDLSIETQSADIIRFSQWKTTIILK